MKNRSSFKGTKALLGLSHQLCEITCGLGCARNMKGIRTITLLNWDLTIYICFHNPINYVKIFPRPTNLNNNYLFCQWCCKNMSCEHMSWNLHTNKLPTSSPTRIIRCEGSASSEIYDHLILSYPYVNLQWKRCKWPDSSYIFNFAGNPRQEQ